MYVGVYTERTQKSSLDSEATGNGVRFEYMNFCFKNLNSCNYRLCRLERLMAPTRKEKILETGPLARGSLTLQVVRLPFTVSYEEVLEVQETTSSSGHDFRKPRIPLILKSYFKV
jgi:hypothetical protein